MPAILVKGLGLTSPNSPSGRVQPGLEPASGCEATRIWYRLAVDGQTLSWLRHAGRDCPEPVLATEKYEEPIGAIDDVPRNITDYDRKDKSTGGKRVNVRRKRQRPEGTQKQRSESESEKRYRAALVETDSFIGDIAEEHGDAKEETGEDKEDEEMQYGETEW